MTPSDALDFMLFRLGETLRSGFLSEWERGFVRSILRHAKRPAWTPTPKQLRMMKRVLRDARADDRPMIEEDA